MAAFPYVPDKGTAQHDTQSIRFSIDDEVLSAAAARVDARLSGCVPTQQGSPNMTVACSAGTVLTNGVVYSVSAGNWTVGTADATNPRIDLLVVTSAGALAVRAGTAAAAPKPPARTANDVVCGHVWVPANDTTITDDQITRADMADVTSTPGAPFVVSVGASFSGTGVPTATLPGTRAANDILVLCLQSSNEADVAPPTGYTRFGPQNGIGAAATAGSTKLSIFWKRDTGTESAPTIPDTGDHTYGFMFAVRGCVTSGDPFRFLGNTFKFAASTSATGPVGVTDIDNMLVLTVFAHGVDSASAQATGAANSSLASVTEAFDGSTADGTGGGLVLVSGIKALSGDVTATTLTWGSSSVDVSTMFAAVPAGAVKAQATRPAEKMIYIGSPPDLDDVWVKPSGVRAVFAQICDGGGGGSGGNTTTTAAGGGGGGGGGYDEAWYRPEDLGATATVHAGKGGAAGTALNQAGNPGVLSEFDKGNRGPLTSTSRIAGTAATAAASADGGNGGCGSGRGLVSPAVATTRISLEAATAGSALGGVGGRGGSGTTAPTGGSPADWGGGGGESGADTDAAITSANNGWSVRGAGGGSGGRTNTNISGSGQGGGAAGVNSAQGAAGAASTRLPFGGSGGVGGGSTVVTGGPGGFPGGGGGGGAGVAGGFGGAGGHGCVVVTTFF
jgi:hypothetical protein